MDDEGIQIAIAGVGGAGSNAVNRMTRLGAPKKARLMAFNTDRKHLSTLDKSIDRMLLGNSITKGMGTGGFPSVGEKAAQASRRIIGSSVKDTDLLFICAGMGGGTGTGAAPIIAQMAKDAGALVVAMVTFPFQLEKARIGKAQSGIAKMADIADTVIVIDNNKLYKYVPNLPMDKAFEVADSVIARAASGITKTILEPSLMNLDFADLSTLMADKGIGMISVGDGSGYARVEDASAAVMKNALLDAEPKDATGVLMHLTGGPDLTLGEATHAADLITDGIPDDANVLLGARIDDAYEKRLEAFAIFTGIPSPLLLAPNKL
jgi:cell division protein FtsZ